MNPTGSGLSLAVGVSLAESLHPRIQLKWPNDLLLGGKKFCGILIEMNAEATRVRYAVVGMGINVNQETFSPGIADESIITVA